MDLTCPQCNQALPEVDELQYRFCPHCGAEIDTGPRPLDKAFLTIPPDLPPPPQAADAGPEDPVPAPERATPVKAQFDEQTAAPQPITLEKRPQIIPPAEPPPPSFFRGPPAKPEPPTPTPKKQQAEKAPPPPPTTSKQARTKNHNKVLIAVLIILALVILILGGLFTF